MHDIDLKLRAARETSDSDHYIFRAQISSTNLVLRFSDNADFAFLNTRTGTVLADLLDRPRVQLDAIGSIQAFRETISRATKESHAMARVDITIYGFQEDLEFIGQQLSRAKIFLQRPNRQRPDTHYNNPHLLKFPGLKMPALDCSIQLPHDGDSVFKDSKISQQAISNVYASLTRGTNLNKVDGDRRLKTQLLS